ncbi:ketopantoate reductase family protein [Pedobacter deserti]|uniref:ketopantoate reductase family protein n=1 Tax=Pedobacter deserti TaxID=2817382 RepID=UPI00210B7628|nr:2-dehydropantoate 2-reductase [Pedobacter sp. SYSU D00382]
MDFNLHIYIIGAGAVGKALAVLLKSAGRRVTLIRGSVDDGSSRMEIHEVELADGTIRQAELEVATLQCFEMLEGIVVIASKAYGNSQLAASLQGRTGKSPITILQNGLGVEKAFVDLQFPAVYRCVLFVTSQVMSAGLVRFKPVSACPIGVAHGDGGFLDDVVSHLSTSQFNFRLEPDIALVIWKKAIVNCVFNSVCPLLEADNGLFHRSLQARDLARRIIKECCAVANSTGIIADPFEIEAQMLQISRVSEGQEISTLQDIRHHRRTEMDSLNMEVVRIADSLSMIEQVKLTRAFGELILLKSGLMLL